MSKRALYIADTLDNARGFQQALAEQGVEVAAGSTIKLRKLMQPRDDLDLVIFEARGTACAFLEEVESLAEERRYALLLIVDEVSVRDLELPTHIPCDFIMHGAGHSECSIRIRRLLGNGGKHTEINVIKYDNMTINLATYQVSIADELVDLGVFYPAPAYSDEAIRMFLARGLHMGAQDLDPDEFLNVEYVPLEDLVRQVLAGEIPDVKTQSAVLRVYTMLKLGTEPPRAGV